MGANFEPVMLRFQWAIEPAVISANPATKRNTQAKNAAPNWAFKRAPTRAKALPLSWPLLVPFSRLTLALGSSRRCDGLGTNIRSQALGQIERRG